MSLCYAIGDVHGRDDLLEAMLERIALDRQFRHPVEEAKIIYLGDYIDRGPGSRRVVDLVMKGLPGFANVCLKGNHEDMMLSFLDTESAEAWRAWSSNGGSETLQSFGVSDRFGVPSAREVVDAIGAERLAWLRSLALFHRDGDYLFVHAGILPGKTVEEQDERDLIWIRGKFLTSDANHGYVVVHGHTPSDEPDVRANRIGIDTGAVSSGRLTAAVLGEPDGPRFLMAEGEPYHGGS